METPSYYLRLLPSSLWHDASLYATFIKQCWKMQTNSKILCNAKVGTGTPGTLVPIYKGLRKQLFHQQWRVWGLVCPYDIKHCVSGSKKTSPIIPNMWSTNIGINFLRDKVLVFRDIEVLQQKELFLQQCKPLAIATFPSFEHIFVCP